MATKVSEMTLVTAPQAADLIYIPVSSGATFLTRAITVPNLLKGVSDNTCMALTRGSIIVGSATGKGTTLAAKTSAYILIGDGNDLKSVAVTGDVTITNAGVTTIGAGKVLADELGVTAGTAEASKALVLGVSKEIATITSATITTLTAPTVNATNLDAGSSGVAGTVDVFPTTAAKGKLAITCADNSDDYTLTIVNASHGQATTLTIPDIGQATGNLVLLKAAQTTAGELKRADLTAETTTYRVPLSDLRSTDTAMGLLGAAAGTPAGAFGITVGSHGTASPLVVSEAANGAAITNTTRFAFVLPAEYVAASNVTLRVHAKITATATASATLDAQVYESDGEAGISADLCATAAIDINGGTDWADRDFTITGTNLVAGDLLDIELTGAADDTGGTKNAIIQIGSVKLLASAKA